MQTKSTTAHTVRHTPDAYLVLDPSGATVATFDFDAEDFHGSRRIAYRDALAYAAELDEAADAALVTALIDGADACTPAPSDDALIAAAGGMRACPFTTCERFDEIQVIDRRTREIVDSTDRHSSRAHTMSVQPRRRWPVELRAALVATDEPERDDEEGLERAERELAARCACFADAMEHPACLAAGRCLNLNAPQPDPTEPSPVALTDCLVDLGDYGHGYLDGTGKCIAQGMNPREVFERGRRLAARTGRPVRVLACSLDDLAAEMQRASAA